MGAFKWIFGAIGWALAGPIGGIIGFIVGAAADGKGVKKFPGANSDMGYNGGRNASNGGYGSGYSPQEQRNSFMISLLVLSTAVMKADGRVLRSELEYVKVFIRNNFGEDAMADSLKVIQGLLNKNINVPQICAQIKVNMVIAQRLQLYHYLAGIAKADGAFSHDEYNLLLDIASYLGINEKDAQSILEMYGGTASDPYKILEIEHTATDEEVKKAYRRMAVKYHPDKVETLGEDVKRAANEKFKSVQEAYEKIKIERGLN